MIRAPRLCEPRRRPRRLGALALGLGLGLIPQALEASRRIRAGRQNMQTEALVPEQKIGWAKIPEVRLPVGHPFTSHHTSITAGLVRDGAEVRLKAMVRGSKEATIRVYASRFSTDAEIQAELDRGHNFPLQTESRGAPLYEKTLRFDEKVLSQYQALLEARKSAPASLFDTWRLQQWTQNKNKEAYVSYGIDASKLSIPVQEKDSIYHGIEGQYPRFFTHSAGEALNRQGYGSDDSGFRDQPWVDVRTAYVFGLDVPIELPDFGPYVVKVETDHGSHAQAFLHSDLAVWVETHSEGTRARTVSRLDGQAIPGVDLKVFHRGRKANFEALKKLIPKNDPGAAPFLQQFTQQFEADSGGSDQRTDALGRTQFRSAFGGTALVLARKGNRLAVAQGELGFHPSNYHSRVAHLTTDRPVYKPGETIQFRGVVRKVLEGTELEVVSGESFQVRLGWNQQVQADVRTDEFGTFHGSLEIPKDFHTGMVQLQLSGNSVHANLPVTIEVYRKPEHELLLEPIQETTIQGEDARIRFKGRYTVGGATPGAKVRWTRSARGAGSSPVMRGMRLWCEGPGWNFYPPSSVSVPSASGEVELDDAGNFLLDFVVPKDKNDYDIRLHATLVAPDGRTVESETQVYAPRSEWVLAMKSTMSLVDEGEPWVVDARVFDLDGKPRPAEVELEVRRRRWVQESSRWVEKVDVMKRWSETVDAQGFAKWKIPLTLAGNIELVAKTKDPKGRETSSQISTYRFGADAGWWRWDRLEITPELDSYQPGQTAKVLVQAPLETGEVHWTLASSKLLHQGSAPIAGYQARIEIPIDAGAIPEARLTVRTFKDHREVRAQKVLEVPAQAMQAEMKLTPDKRVYQPGEEVELGVEVLSAQGRGLEGVFCLAVVDQALDQIAPDQTPPLYQTFFGTRSVWMRDFYDSVPQQGVGFHLGRGGYGGGMPMAELAFASDAEGLAAPAPQAKMAMRASVARAPGGAGGGQIQVRSEFRDVAYWLGSAETDASGKTKLRFRLPDDLARWKLVAYFVDPRTRIATGRERIVARKDLMVRMGIPRFFTQGDHVLMKADVQNLSDQDRRGELTFSLEGGRAVPLGDEDLARLNVRKEKGGWLVFDQGVVPRAPDAYRIEAPAKGQRAVDFPIYVFDYPKSGELSLKTIFNSDGDGDGLLKKVPVVPFAKRRTEIRLEKVDGQAQLKIEPKQGTEVDATEAKLHLLAGLESALATILVDDLEMLADYRYGCTEQTLSRFLPLVSARSHLGESWLKKAGLKPLNFDTILDKGVERLKKLRHGNGWGWAPGDQASIEITSYVLSRVARLEAETRKQLAKDLKLNESLRWIQSLYKQNLKKALSESEDRVRDGMAVVRAYEALAAWGQRVPSPPLSSLGELAKAPRFWASLGMASLDLRDMDRVEKCLEALRGLALRNQAFTSWSQDEGAYSWYSDNPETTARVLEFLQAAQAASHSVGEDLEKGMRWMAMGPSRYRSTKARAIATNLSSLHLAKKDPVKARVSSLVRVSLPGQGKVRRKVDPARPPRAVILEAPKLAAAGHRIDLKVKGPEVMARLETTRFELGPFSPEDHGFEVRSRMLTEGKVHPSHEYLTREVTLKADRSYPYALVEVPLLSGGEVPKKGPQTVQVERKSKNGKWYGTGVRWDVLDDRVVFYLHHLGAGEYRFRVPMLPELAGYHNVNPARAFLMYFPHIEGSSESHRIEIGRKD